MPHDVPDDSVCEQLALFSSVDFPDTTCKWMAEKRAFRLDDNVLFIFNSGGLVTGLSSAHLASGEWIAGQYNHRARPNTGWLFVGGHAEGIGAI